MTGASELHHRKWTQRNQHEPASTALESPLLALHHSSDVDPLLPEQIDDAREVLRLRRSASEGSGAGEAGGAGESRVATLQRRIVERFLAGRRERFGEAECGPFPQAAEFAREGRDTFLVVKFMDEAPHMAATLDSLLGQREVDPNRLVIVAVDNNSTDGTDRIVHEAIAANRTPIRMIYLNQDRPGAGHAARLGVDRCIATVLEMCRHDQRWDRLQTAAIAVTDGDTVYHRAVVGEVRAILDSCPDVDGVMPFLTYKFTAALRLFHRYAPAFPDDLAAAAGGGQDEPALTRVPVPLADTTAHDALPRTRRRPQPDGTMLVEVAGAAGHDSLRVELPHKDAHGRRFAVLVGSDGERAYLLQDRTLVLAKAPVSGFDAAMVHLENGGVARSEKWRWHALVGHDLFLYWAFAGIGLPEAMVYPDSSDALKTFRVWSFAIGGQHQLKRSDLRIATGSDYQSGRVLQATGCTLRLGPARAFAETEIDRLIKMVRNLANRQSVFYGATRSGNLERATGLYVHMTRIQTDLEQELRDHPDEVYETVVFPERVLFPLRWLLQNIFRFYAHDEPEAGQLVRERVLATIFGEDEAADIEARWFNQANLTRLEQAPYHEQQDIAEGVAEGIIAENYPRLMAFYARTLRDFLTRQGVAAEHWEWLLDGLPTSRNALLEKPPPVHPAAVWDGDEFDIDVARGQVLRMRPTANDTGRDGRGDGGGRSDRSNPGDPGDSVESVDHGDEGEDRA